MADGFHDLLEATERHLVSLKTRGEKFVNVQPATLATLNRPAPKRSASAPAQRTPSPPTQSAAPALHAPLTPPPRPLAQPSAGTDREVTSKVAAPSGAGATQAEKQDAEGGALGRRSVEVSAKQDALAVLRGQALACTRCPHLVASRTQVVFGVGSVEAELMFVGEAPGADEDAQGEPFVGLAGQLLTKIIEAMGLSRGQVYIGNILKCRPDTPGQSAGNRKPRPEEMATCIPWLHQQIDIIQPRVLVALGATAVEGLLGKTVGISKLRGQWQTYRGIPLMPTYHPAYLLRNQSLGTKRQVWEDMLQVMAKLGMPISTKQRGFFLKK